eukprot:RCo055192
MASMYVDFQESCVVSDNPGELAETLDKVVSCGTIPLPTAAAAAVDPSDLSPEECAKELFLQAREYTEADDFPAALRSVNSCLNLLKNLPAVGLSSPTAAPSPSVAIAPPLPSADLPATVPPLCPQRPPTGPPPKLRLPQVPHPR